MLLGTACEGRRRFQLDTPLSLSDEVYQVGPQSQARCPRKRCFVMDLGRFASALKLYGGRGRVQAALVGLMQGVELES